MTLQDPRTINGQIFSVIKEISGKLIERRRRREHIPQKKLAQIVGRSERWLREIEAGITSSMLEDHIRCAHALRMTTTHLFIPLLAMEHKMAIPRELLLQDDLWDLEREILEVVNRRQTVILSRQAARSDPPTSGTI